MNSRTDNRRSNPAPYQRFEPGQCWSYRTRPGEEQSRALVVKLDAVPPDLTLVHIRLTGLAIHAGNGEVLTYVSHLPLSEEALAASVSRLESTGAPLPDWAGSYNNWRVAFEAGDAGIWTAPLASIVQAIEDGLTNSTPSAG